MWDQAAEEKQQTGSGDGQNYCDVDGGGGHGDDEDDSNNEDDDYS